MISSVFDSDVFKMDTMTAAVNKMPYVPGRIGRLGIFEESGVSTTTVIVEEQSGTLSLIPNTPRSAPPNQNAMGKRKARSFVAPHLPIEDTVLASEIQNVRAFGSSSQLQGLESVRDDKLRTMAAKLDATLEYHRVGAIKGVVLDADGTSEIFDLFDKFDVTQTEVDFLLGTSTTDILGKCTAVAGAIEDELGAAVYNHVHAVVGKTFFQRFIAHDKVREAYKYYQQQGKNMNPLREDLRYQGFEFGGIIWEQYRGSVGGVGFVADSEAHFFPVGVPGLFITRYAPGDFVEAANTLGLPRYVKSERMEYDRGLKLLLESNPVNLCTRPKVLVKGTTGN